MIILIALASFAIPASGCNQDEIDEFRAASADELVRQYAFRVNRKLSKHRVHIHHIRDIGYQLIETGKGHG